MFVYDKDTPNVMLVSCNDKKKTRKKNVILLTTMHNKMKTTKDKRLKPQFHTMYEHKKFADVVNLLSTSHSTRIKSNR